ncbi:hypothetical protein KDA08_00960 [Candidatus Saccharibacteria bacterium]|nr:hypothetical protein [Candidatus Saccharibacteria bacterium]
MGGINCPPGGNREVSPILTGEYINNLAHYCEDLFTGVSAFWDANAQIESAVLSNGKLDGAILALKKSEEHLGNAKSHLGTVASLWSMINPEELYGFETQIVALNATVHAIIATYMELSILTDDSHLQELLWDETISKCFNIAAVCVHDLTSWQTQFAKSASRTRV